MSNALRLLHAVRIADVLDVLVVALLIYLIARWLFRRTSVAVAVGLSFVLLLYLAARYWSMYLTLAAFRGGAVLIVVVLAIVFQEDIRRGIERLAAWRPGRAGGTPQPLQVANQILVEAVDELAERSLGALIVLAGREPLEAHVRGGIPLGGRPSLPLLVSLFHHKTPGHDGAAIMDGPVLTRFAVHLPLSKNVSRLGRRGTRHAAALGLSEVCDAMVIVVSEEQATISVAEHGVLTQLDSPTELHGRMDAFYTQHSRKRATGKRSGHAADWGLKAASLLAACLLWVVVAFRVDMVERVVEGVPVEYRSLPAGWQVERIDPAAVDVRLSGPERAFDHLDRESLRVSLDQGDYILRSGMQRIEVPPEALKLPPDVQFAPGDPPSIWLKLEQMVQIESMLEPRLVGEPPPSHRVEKVSIQPQKVRMTVPSHHAQRAKKVRTEAIELASVRQTFSLDVKLELPPGAALINRPNERVKVTVEVVPVEEEEIEDRDQERGDRRQGSGNRNDAKDDTPSKLPLPLDGGGGRGVGVQEPSG